MNRSETPNPTVLHNQPRHALYGTLMVVLIWFAMAVAIPVFFISPPNPIAADSNDSDFSAIRAMKILEHLVGDGIPHPAGSEQNNVVRERIVKLLENDGYEVEIQKTSNTIGRVPGQESVPLENIIAVLPGKNRGQAIMLAAHYDSSPNGPGASDDGVGMAAVLEIARMLKSEGPFQHDIVFLISDGEELGLLGADKFMESHRWAKQIECVVNLEARGTKGASFMFETSEHSRWLVPVFAKSVRRPMTSSLFYEVYKTMPNDTDFTMFKRGGIQGFNFAFVGDVINYHTSEDNLANVNLPSFQHHGENMLGLARTLADFDFESQREGKVVYFDVLGRFVVWWPVGGSLPISLVVLVLITGAGVYRIYVDSQRSERKPSLVTLGAGLLFALASFLLVLGICFIADAALRLDGTFENPWPEFPWPVQISLFFYAFTTICAIAWLANNGIEQPTSWNGVWLLWAILAVLVSWKLSGASYLFIVPTLIASVSGLLFLRKNQSQFWPAAIGAIVCGFLWLPLEALFFDALGFKFKFNLPTLIRVALISTTLLPVVMSCDRKGRSILAAIFGSISILTTLAAIWMVK